MLESELYDSLKAAQKHGNTLRKWPFKLNAENNN